ncbi:hypothetical protein FB45DRAFT_944375 [Roridomyces roridus]|uniref:Alcohol acetyltransferase n=1 Tax=Roridomyces roridus TaxID=1738132 RepID=A0AAD7B333_9AGAR|nr:hypothetical protein FB45DRAFT_944375 [Roridomyces roridus]
MTPTKLRQLDTIERYHATRVYLELDTCIAASARYTTADDAVLTKEILFPALRAVIERHAALGICYDRRPDSKDIAFRRLSTLDLSRIIEFSDRDLQTALGGQLSRGWTWDEEDMLPLWRVEVLPGNIVLLAMHHGVGDGLSTREFHYSLFRALQSASLPAYSTSVAVPELPLLPGIFHLTKARPSLKETLSMFWHTILPNPWNKHYSTWTGKPFPRTMSPVKPYVRLVSFTPTESDNFTKLCRSHDATITAALYELAVTTFTQLIKALPDAARYKAIHISVASAFRAVLGGESEICNYVESMPCDVRLHAEFSWTTAGQASAEFRRQKAKGPAHLGIINWVAGDFTGFMKGEFGNKRMATMILSNLGRSDVPAVPEGKWSIDRIFFAQADSVVGPAMAMNVAGDGPKGGLNITFTWGEKSVEMKFAEEFVSAFEKAVRRMSAE